MDIQFDPNAEQVDESVSPALPELNSDLRGIFGRPNFTCHFIAKALRQMGFDIPQKSEEEQAATIYWALRHYLRDRINWRDDHMLAAKIGGFQFRDIRPKAASEIVDIRDASLLLGHTKQEITKRVYRRVGVTAKPSK